MQYKVLENCVKSALQEYGFLIVACLKGPILDPDFLAALYGKFSKKTSSSGSYSHSTEFY